MNILANIFLFMNYRKLQTVAIFNFMDMLTTITMKTGTIIVIAVMRFEGE